MVTPGLYYGLQMTLKASATFSNKVHIHGIPILIDLGLQGHQIWMDDSLDLYPKTHPYGIIQRIQLWVTWRPDGLGPVFCQIYFIRVWVVLVLCLGRGMFFWNA